MANARHNSAPPGFTPPLLRRLPNGELVSAAGAGVSAPAHAGSISGGRTPAQRFAAPPTLFHAPHAPAAAVPPLPDWFAAEAAAARRANSLPVRSNANHGNDEDDDAHHSQQHHQLPVILRSTPAGHHHHHLGLPHQHQQLPRTLPGVRGSPLQRSVSPPGPDRINSLEMAAQPPFSVPQPATESVMVFKGRVAASTLHQVGVPVGATVADLSKEVQRLFGLPTYTQTLVALGSPKVSVFKMSSLPLHKATMPVPVGCSFLVQASDSVSGQEEGSEEEPHSAEQQGMWQWEPAMFHVNPHAPLMRHTPSPSSPCSEFQEEVREQLSFALHTRHSGLTLQRVSKECPFSTAALSMWRRGVYRGNTLGVARAVKAALVKLVPGIVFSVEEPRTTQPPLPQPRPAAKRRRLDDDM